MIIDAQVHLWAAETPNRPWPVDGQKRAHLKAPMSYENMLSDMDKAGVDRVIIVPPSWEGDRNDYALMAAHHHPNRFAVMGRLCLEDSASPSRLFTWMNVPALLGVRVNFSDEKLRWLSDGTADWFWPAAEKAGIPIMMHCPGQQQKIADIAMHHPNLKIIIDHMNLSTRLPVDKLADAVRATARLAKFPNLSVKLSSVPVYSRESFPYQNMDHHLRHMIDSFGAERCHWGSDLSHGKGKIPYENYVRHFTEGAFFHNTEERRWVMGASLQKILKWPSDHS
jgi:predicted TIM-barrel fold metal-dependent hydrolase